MPFGPIVSIEGEAQLRKALKDAGQAKDLTKANKEAAKVAVEDAKSAADTAQERSATSAIAARATQSAAAIAIQNTKSTPYGVGAFMGALKYPQFQKWVGNDWDLLEGTGPYALRDAFKGSGLDRFKEEYSKQIAATMAAAGINMEV